MTGKVDAVESLARVLSRNVIEALVQIGLTQDDILSGPIEHVTLPWQTPPLVIDATLFGTPLSEFIDRSVYVNTEAMTMLWSEALANMRNHPDKVLVPEGFRSASRALPNVKLRERPLYLSVPEGYPGGITDYAAVMLSLECAHIMRHNSKLAGFVHDEDNYYAILDTGVEVGIKDGLPAMYGEIWDIPVIGMVQDMLRAPRSSVFEGCDYNIISKVRSLVRTYQDNLRDFEALEWALQALRVVDGQKALLDAVYHAKWLAHTRKVRNSALRQAVEVVNQLSMTDRQRIETLKHLLVPEVITSGQFSKTIYPFNKLPPPVLSEKVSERVKQTVVELYELEELHYSSKTVKQHD